MSISSEEHWSTMLYIHSNAAQTNKYERLKSTKFTQQNRLILIYCFPETTIFTMHVIKCYLSIVVHGIRQSVNYATIYESDLQIKT